MAAALGLAACASESPQPGQAFAAPSGEDPDTRLVFMPFTPAYVDEPAMPAPPVEVKAKPIVAAKGAVSAR